MLKLRILIFFGAVAILTAFLSWVGPSHYIPTQKMARAIDQGDGCLVFIGSSRMAAAYDEDSLKAEFRKRGHQPCLGDLGLGGVGLDGQFVTIRHYLRHRPNPRAVVVGFHGADLFGVLDPTQVPFSGNRAVMYRWGHPGDLSAYYTSLNPSFAELSLKFLVLGAIPATAFVVSGVWYKVLAFQQWLTSKSGTDSTPSPANANRFGQLEDMTDLATQNESAAAQQFAHPPPANGEWAHSVWFSKIETLIREKHIPLILVELPAPQPKELPSVADGRKAYRQWLTAHSADKNHYVNLDEGSWTEPELFMDDLHVSPKGARKASQHFAEILPNLW